MKYKFAILAVTLLSVFSIHGQSTNSNDVGKIIVTSFVPQQDAIPSSALKNLESKINQMVSLAGMSSLSNSRFAIIPHIIVTDKQVQASAPPMVVVNMDITYYFGDVESGNVFGSLTKSYKGVGQNDAKAYISVFNNVKPKDQEIVEFMESGKVKIIEYYNKMADQIIKKAITIADRGQYDEAIALVMTIPDACEKYSQAIDAASNIFKKKIDTEGAVLYNEAYTIWNSQQNYEGAEQACSILSKIHPLSSYMPKALTLSDNIGKRVREIDKREWNFMLKQQQNEVDIQKALINATMEVAKAEANRPVYNYNVIWW